MILVDTNPMDMLGKLMADPEAIKNIKDMLGNASQSQNSNNDNSNTGMGDLPDAMPLIYEFLNNQQNSEMFKKINKAYSGYTNNTTPGLRLLDALKPYLNPKRTENFEKIRKAVKISNAFSEFKR